MSKCAQGRSSGTKADKNPAAVAAPPSRPPVLFKSALWVGDIQSKNYFMLSFNEKFVIFQVQSHKHFVSKNDIIFRIKIRKKSKNIKLLPKTYGSKKNDVKTSKIIWKYFIKAWFVFSAIFLVILLFEFFHKLMNWSSIWLYFWNIHDISFTKECLIRVILKNATLWCHITKYDPQKYGYLTG